MEQRGKIGARPYIRHFLPTFYSSEYVNYTALIMTGPLRIEYAEALYHVTSLCNAQQKNYITNNDRLHFLELLAHSCERYGWFCHAYCLMYNHYHLLIETQNPTLPKGIKYLNRGYTQFFSRARPSF